MKAWIVYSGLRNRQMYLTANGRWVSASHSSLAKRFYAESEADKQVDALKQAPFGRGPRILYGKIELDIKDPEPPEAA